MSGSGNLSAGKAFVVLVAVIAVLATFLLLGAVMGLTEMWPAFILLLCWSFLEDLSVTALPRVVLGALLGIAVAAVMGVGPQAFGASWGAALGIVAVLVLVYAFILGKVRMLVNPTTMVFLTVLTIPHVQGGAALSAILAGFAWGVVYFGTIGWVLARLKKQSTSPA